MESFLTAPAHYTPLAEFRGVVSSMFCSYELRPGVDKSTAEAFLGSLLHRRIITKRERVEVAQQAAALFEDGFMISFVGKKSHSMKMKEPATFKASSRAVLLMGKQEQDIFSALEAKKARVYLWQGEPRRITSTDFIAFQLAAMHALYNQSIEAGNADSNCGITEEYAEDFSTLAGQHLYFGNIEVTLRDFCRAGYGCPEPSPRQLAAMRKTLFALQGVYVRIDFPKGKTEAFQLLSLPRISEPEKGKDTVYRLRLNPIFTMISKQFILLPQKSTQIIANVAGKATRAHFSLFLLIAQQRAATFSRHIDTLLTTLRISPSEYASNRKRAEIRVLEVCMAIQRTGIISSFKVFPEGYAAKPEDGRRLEKVEFKKNPDFLRALPKR